MENNPALAVVLAVIDDLSDYGFKDDTDRILFIRLWAGGEFEACREYWPNLSDKVYKGADPLFVENKNVKAN